MNVCFISPEVPPYLSGGAGVATLNFSKVLVKRGHDITIIARKLAGGKSFEVIDGIRVYQVQCTKIRFLQLSHIIFIIRALKLALKINADIYYAQTVISPGLISALLHWLGKKTIVHLRGVDLNRGFNFPRKRITNFVLRNNDLIFVLSKEHQEMLKERGFKSYYITNGVAVDFNFTKERCRKILGWCGRHIVYVGRLDGNKGVIYAVRAVEGLDATLHIIGEESGGRAMATDEIKAYVERHNMNNVIFHGVLGRSETFIYIKAADIFLHPLLEAWGMGNAVLEAMCLRTPVIGTNIGYFKELIGNNERGILVEKANHLALRDAINKLLNNKKLTSQADIKSAVQQSEPLLAKLAENAHEYVKENHNWDKIADEFERIVKENLR